MPILAKRMIRKMRGGAQAHLLETEDGAFYVVKFLGNPQYRRILVNEWIAAVVLQYLQIASPEVSLVEITPGFLEANPEVSFQLGQRKIPVEPGWHFGSRYPGDPAVTAVYDFVPDALLEQIDNLTDFAGCFVFDKWMANADGRQSVFHRAERKGLAAGGNSPRRIGFRALMIDHGFVFNGPHWDFPESAVQGLYPRRAVYNQVTSLSSFQPWLDRVTHFPEHVIDQAFRQIPPQWAEGDERELENMLQKLLRRCKRVPDLINDARLVKTNPFVNWRG